MNEEEKLVHDLAVEYHANKGHQFKPLYIAPYTIPGSEEACAYIVSGRIVAHSCVKCDGKHATFEQVLYLRVGRGFVRLDLGKVRRLSDGSIFSEFKSLFDG